MFKHMTNKEFQDILSQYDGDYIICMNKAFGYDSEPNLVVPHLYINTDIGQIEIEPDEYKMLQSDTILKAMELYDKLKSKLSFIGHNEVSANLITNMINYGIEDIDNKNAEVLI